MKAPDFYRNIKGLEYVTNCTSIDLNEWNDLMKGAKRADKRRVERLVKRFLPEVFNALCLNFYNPYNYFRTDEYLIIVHSAIEYFLRIY